MSSTRTKHALFAARLLANSSPFFGSEHEKNAASQRDAIDTVHAVSSGSTAVVNTSELFTTARSYCLLRTLVESSKCPTP